MIAKFSDLKEETARAYYLKLSDIFQKFIQNDSDIYNYSDDFNWEKVNEISEHSYITKNRYPDDEKYDYHFKCNDRLYTLDMSQKSEHLYYFGVNYPLSATYENNIDNLYYCTLIEYHHYFKEEQSRIKMHFIYDRKNKLIIELNAIYRLSLPNIEQPVTRTMHEVSHKKQLTKILVKS